MKDLFYFFAGGVIVFIWAFLFAFIKWLNARGQG
jgi:hypothetical protein